MKTNSFFFFTMVVSSSFLSAQTVSFGVKGGVPLRDEAATPDESRPYIVGPSVEVHLFGGFSVEADALYQRLGTSSVFSFSSGFPIRTDAVRERGNSWEFPVLGKYYFRSQTSAWRPYVATGYSFRTIGLHEAVTEISPDHNGPSHINTRSDLGIGATFAAGVRFHAGRIAVLPEIRYTRWGNSDNLTRKNEAGFLLGINF